MAPEVQAMTPRKLLAAALAAAAFIAAPSAWAEATDLAAAIAAAASPSAAPSAAAPRPDDGLGSALGDTRLAGQRGGQGVQLSDIKARSVVSENTAHHLTTGNNTITESAFGQASGMPMVIQNSGNNVSIQNSTILNLQLR
jgi:hypothetical protein